MNLILCLLVVLSPTERGPTTSVETTVCVGTESGSRLLEVAGGNPFRTQARIQYLVPTAQQVSVRVYDVQGRVVNELASGPHAPGEHRVSWKGTDTQGRHVAAGAYYIELKTEFSGTTRKVVYAR